MNATRLKPVDAVVVGVGVAGSIVCQELAAAGLRVVGLERGRMVDPAQDFAMPYAHDEFRHDSRSPYIQDLARETVTFRNVMNETALPMREIGSFRMGECVGGAGVLWGGLSWRFLPWDFETKSRTDERYGKNHMPADCTNQDWGLTYEDLEPYYDQFEHIYGVSGKAGNLNGEIQAGGNPFEGPRSREYPNPPTTATAAGALFGEAAKSLGYTPFSPPTSGVTQAYTNLYKVMLGQCQRGGFCSSYVCAMGAKGSPLTAVMPALQKQPTFELRPLCNVIRIDKDSDGKKATGVTYIDARGRTVHQPADIVVLTSYTFNNTRLMLLSGIGAPYDPATGRGVIGRNYTYQATGSVKLFFDDRTFNSFMGGGGSCTAIDDYNGDNYDHSGLGFIGGGYIVVNSRGAAPINSHPVPPGTAPWGSGWKKAVANYYDRSFAISSHGGCQAYRNNYLDLDPTYRDANGLPLIRMTFDWREPDLKMSEYVTQRAAEIGKALNPSRMSASPVKGQYSIVPYQVNHNTGGVIMGADPESSALNKYLQSWDVPNVFVIGASAFPQNSANAPTETVGALACWAADAIKEQYLKRPGLLV